MGIVGNIQISIKEKAFADVAPKKKQISKVLVGVGNGYSNENREMRFLKLFFGNNANQTTKTLSYTKPIKTKDIEAVKTTIKNVLARDLYELKKDVEVETDGISLKDRKIFREFMAKLAK